MQIQIQVHIVGVTVVNNSLDHSLVGHLIRGFSVGVTTEPKILVDGESNAVGVPNTHRLSDQSYIIGHGDPIDGCRWRSTIPLITLGIEF